VQEMGGCFLQLGCCPFGVSQALTMLQKVSLQH
jgi:hypothetical protein